jgi:DNA-binding transcriptional regulator YiaG
MNKQTLFCAVELLGLGKFKLLTNPSRREAATKALTETGFIVQVADDGTVALTEEGNLDARNVSLVIKPLKKSKSVNQPTPSEISTARNAEKLTQAEFGALLHSSARAVRAWESETDSAAHRDMPLATWELWLIKSDRSYDELWNNSFDEVGDLK